MKILKTKWLDLTAVVIALVALFFSWQANMIGQSQITPKIVLIDAKSVGNLPSSLYSFNGHLCMYGATKDQPPAPRIVCTVQDNLYCVHQFRIANLGGANTSIVDFEATISYLDQKMFIKGNGEPTVSMFEQGKYFWKSTISFAPSKENIYVPDFDPVFSEILIPKIDLLQLPAPIGGYSTVDIFSESIIYSDANLDNPFFVEQRSEEPYAYIDISYSYYFRLEKDWQSQRFHVSLCSNN